MKLLELQRRVFRAITEPLTPSENMRRRGLDGRSMREEAEAIIKPNDRLTSFERLEIYNRQYWFRVLASLREDFPGLRAIVGERRFEKLCQDYLIDCPSRSYTLRDLGKRLHAWLAAHPAHAGRHLALALDMIALEWAHIEAFDAAQLPSLTADDVLDLANGGADFRLRLQPYLQIIAVQHPVDDIHLAITKGADGSAIASNAVRPHRGKAVKHDLRCIKAQPVYLAVHRQENTIYYKRLDAEAFHLLRALGRGRSLVQAIATAFKGSAMTASERAAYARDAFAHWTTLGWFCRG